MVDRPFVLQLWEDRTRGEQWVASYDTKGLALLGDEFLRIASNNAVDNGQRIFEFKAVQPGVYRIVFEKRMGWKFTSEDRRLFTIEAQPVTGIEFMPDIAFINGRFLPWQDATVSIDDRGFQFGDAVYEVIRTYRGSPFEMSAHLDRLDRSATQLSISQPYTRRQWTQWIHQGLSLAGYQDAKIYIQVTRGVAPREHGFPSESRPTVVMTIRAIHPLSVEMRHTGVTACTCEDLRWGRCDIKSVNLLANVLAREEARKEGVFEAILVRDGLVMEGAVSNVMAVQEAYS